MLKFDDGDNQNKMLSWLLRESPVQEMCALPMNRATRWLALLNPSE